MLLLTHTHTPSHTHNSHKLHFIQKLLLIRKITYFIAETQKYQIYIIHSLSHEATNNFFFFNNLHRDQWYESTLGQPNPKNREFLQRVYFFYFMHFF